METTRSTEPRDSRDAQADLAVAAERWRRQIVATAVACLLVLAAAAGAIFQWTDVRAGLLVLSHVGVLVAGALAGAGWALRHIDEVRNR